ncbi:MAG: P-loop NTPase, partial [Chitinophagaceae bacterium]|nr:P-loop NTPase [Chitinophagaceae bacterium]
PPELPENKYYIFGKGGGRRLADMFEVPYLGELPIALDIREGGDIGRPAFLSGDANTINSIGEIAQQVARNISIRNANLDPTKVVEITL